MTGNNKQHFKHINKMKITKRNNGLNTSFNPVLDSFFNDDFFNWPKTSGRWNNLPPVNISETEDSFKVDIAAPGFDKKDFKVELDNNILNVSAERKDSNENKSENFSRREFFQSSFKRSFTLPENKVSESDINANYESGVLSLTLPKKEEAKAQPRKLIEIS